jgi:thiamine-phosphate pyrophosphorylase
MQKKFPNVFLFIDKFNLKDLSLLDKNIDIIYRNYKKKANKNTLISIKNFCRKSKRKFYISNNIKQATQLNIDGVYIPSFNKQINYSNISSIKSFDIIGSAHNKKEIAIKKAQNCRLIFLSPLFESYKNKKILNVIKYNLAALNEKKQFIALGGINETNIKKVNLTNSIGFAGIRGLKKNGLKFNLRPFYKS